MRVIIFSWEYPPRVIGKLAEYVSNLSARLVKSKVETYVVTYHDTMTGVAEESNGVKVIRVANPVQTHISLLTWVLTLNQEVERVASNVFYQTKHIDLIDVHDWHFVPAAVTLKNALGIPFIYSVESLEDHRSPSANQPFNMAIRGIEWLGFYEAQEVSTKTEWMQGEVNRLYQVPKEKIRVITPNVNSWIKNTIETYSSAVETGVKNK
ncbi:MAG: glycosyltransferase [Candidatus Bathyarchaeota archaeon]|nr:glycosyltransferase [Candidatus Bathyarchaeota archaeon]